MNDRERMMRNVQMYHLALEDTILFLDSHPEDRDALSYFGEVREKNNEAMSAFESKYGPLTSDRAPAADRWTWVDGPWPWENDRGDN